MGVFFDYDPNTGVTQTFDYDPVTEDVRLTSTQNLDTFFEAISKREITLTHGLKVLKKNSLTMQVFHQLLRWNY